MPVSPQHLSYFAVETHLRVLVPTTAGDGVTADISDITCFSRQKWIFESVEGSLRIKVPWEGWRLISNSSQSPSAITAQLPFVPTFNVL